jgi:hypothetical protein
MKKRVKLWAVPLQGPPLCEKNSALSNTLILTYSKLCAKLSDLKDHLEYQTVKKIVLRNLYTNNPVFYTLSIPKIGK